MKFCKRCSNEKPETEFPLNKKGKDGIDSTCKECRNATCKAWRERNAEYVTAKQKAEYATDGSVRRERERLRYQREHEKMKKRNKEYVARNRERILSKWRRERTAENPKWSAYLRDYRSRNIERIRANASRYAKNRKKNPQNRLRQRVCDGIYMALRASGNVKRASTFEMLGYSREELMSHMERQFLKGMTWANYGEWHCDHIVPLKAFDLTDPEQILKAYALTNLRPLWRRENRLKSAKRIYLI